jgi:hypothetical protein
MAIIILEVNTVFYAAFLTSLHPRPDVVLARSKLDMRTYFLRGRIKTTPNSRNELRFSIVPIRPGSSGLFLFLFLMYSKYAKAARR